MDNFFLAGSACFGVVVGWIAYRSLRRSATTGVSDIAAVIGAVGGAAVTGLFPHATGEFSAYCVGLFVGFFGYLTFSFFRDSNEVNEWMGKPRIRP